MTERRGVERRNFLRGGMLGALGLGLVVGGTAEQHNIRGADRYLEFLTEGFEEFKDIVGSRSDLDAFFPGGFQRLADDHQELRFLFSKKILERPSGATGAFYQLLLPSEEKPFNSLSAAINVSYGTLVEPTANTPRTDRLTISAFFAPPKDTRDYRLFSFDSGLPATNSFSVDQLVKLPSRVFKDSRFSDVDDWLVWSDDSEQVPGSVYKAEKSFSDARLTTGITVESSGYLEYAELIKLDY